MHLRTYSLVAATAILGTLFFVGCKSDSTPASNTDVQTGTFVDSAVKGLYYVSGTQSGTTDANGTFKYKTGEAVKFYLGDANGALIGETNGSSLITPLDFSDDGIDGNKTTNILRMLQSLDKDNNVTNGIEIDTTKAAKVKSFNFSDDANVTAGLTVAGATLKTADEVRAHFRETLATLSITGAVPATATAISTEFIGMDAPTTADKMDHVYSEAYVAVKYSDGTRIIRKIEYKTLMNTGDVIGGTTVGAILDVNGSPIMDTSTATATPFVSDTPDGQSVMQIGSTIQMVSQFEYVSSDASGASRYGVLPAMMNLSMLAQDTNGDFSISKISNIDTKDVGGLWITCAASLSPWNTHLGSEEYEPDAKLVELGTATGTNALTGLNAYFGDTTTANVYNYGFIHETTVDSAGKTTIKKHYSMGRSSKELAQVMPDNKTVYMGDDGSYTMLFMYVADTAGDLSAGTLYAAKWTQTSTATDREVKANLTWVKLGHATDAEVKTLITARTKFSDIFETAASATAGFTKVKTYKGTEYLKLKTGMEKAAAFLESRRYGALLGATSEFNKMEGVTVNAKDKKVYMAISNMSGGMADGSSDPVNDIHAPVEKAGAVFELSLSGGKSDTVGTAISSDYVASTMNAMSVLTGLTATTKDVFGNAAVVSKVANPDNLKFSEKMRTLFVGEDSGMHINNFVWAYNVDTKKFSRILSNTAGAEATGLQAIDNLGGHGYVMSSIQHPGDSLLKDWNAADATVMQLNSSINKKKASIGYMKL
ncbi:MAG: PhoX family protein, partial [Sulfuricurvum sp.]